MNVKDFPLPLSLSGRSVDTEGSRDPLAQGGGAPETTEKQEEGDASADSQSQREGDGATGDGSPQVTSLSVQVCHV